MPNHCENDLYVVGDPDEVQKFLDATHSKRGFEFNKIIPIPEELKGIESGSMKIGSKSYCNWRTLRDHAFTVDGTCVGIEDEEVAELTKKHGASNCYDFCCNTWGTKWGAYEQNLETDEIRNDGLRHIKITYQTAWSPGEPVIKKIIEMFPKLIFVNDFFEAGSAYCGSIHGEEGVVTLTEFDDDYNGNRGG